MKNPEGLILAAAFISGACSLLVEIAGVRVLAPYLGTTVYSWAAVIGFVLASLSVGYYAGGVLADRRGGRNHFSLVLLAAGLSTLLIPFLASALLPFTLFLDIVLASLLGALILVPASCFYGMVSPYAIKLTSQKGFEGRGAGTVFAISTLGSIAGALGTGFILIPNMAITHIFVSAALLMLIASSIVFGFRKERLFEIIPFAFVSLIVLGVPMDPPLRGEALFSSQSEYYNIRVMEMEWNNASARVLFLDNAASSGEHAGGEPAFTYTKKTKELLSAAGDVHEALVIGAGGGTEIENIKDAFPDAHVTGLEIDPEVIETGKRFFSLKDDDRTEIVINDARRFIKTSNSTYDLVLVDVFRGASPPYHLATQEFLFEMKSRMSPGAVVIVNVISPLEGPKSLLFHSLHATYSSVFANVASIPTRDNPEDIQNIILIASDWDISEFIETGGVPAYSPDATVGLPLTDEHNPIELYALR